MVTFAVTIERFVAQLRGEALAVAIRSNAWVLRPNSGARSVIQPEPAFFLLLLWNLQPLPPPDALDTFGVYRPGPWTAAVP